MLETKQTTHLAVITGELKLTTVVFQWDYNVWGDVEWKSLHQVIVAGHLSIKNMLKVMNSENIKRM